MSKYKTLIKDTGIFAIGSFGSKAIVFLLVPLYTNVLTAEEYGAADLVLTFSQLLIPILCLSIYNSIIRFGLENRDKPENTLLTGIIVWLVGCVVLLALLPIVSLYNPISPWKWYLYLHVNSSILLTISQNYLKVKNENLKFSLVSILQTAMLAGLNILLLVFFHIGVKGYLLSNALASLTAAIVAVFAGHIVSDLKRAKFDKDLLVNMLKYSSPLILNNIAWWVIQSSDKVMIDAYVGAAALGMYTVATRIPSLINVVVSVFQQAWNISSIVEMDSSNDSNFYTNVFQVYTGGIFFVCIMINAIIKPFMKIYVGSAFYDAWRLVPILVVSAAAFSAVAAFYGAMYGALKKSINNMLSTLMAALLNVIMNMLFIRFYGALGAVIGTLISYFALAVFRMVDIKRYVDIKVNYTKYIVNCVLLILDAILITNDYHVYLVSSITMIIFIIVNRKSLKTFLNKANMIIKNRGV